MTQHPLTTLWTSAGGGQLVQPNNTPITSGSVFENEFSSFRDIRRLKDRATGVSQAAARTASSSDRSGQWLKCCERSLSGLTTWVDPLALLWDKDSEGETEYIRCNRGCSAMPIFPLPSHPSI